MYVNGREIHIHVRSCIITRLFYRFSPFRDQNGKGRKKKEEKKRLCAKDRSTPPKTGIIHFAQLKPYFHDFPPPCSWRILDPSRCTPLHHSSGIHNVAPFIRDCKRLHLWISQHQLFSVSHDNTPHGVDKGRKGRQEEGAQTAVGRG